MSPDGTLYSWGSNDYGQLGLGLGAKNKIVCQPNVIKALNGVPVAFIACGGYHSFAISKTGNKMKLLANESRLLAKKVEISFVVFFLGVVYGWGKNSFGQLGLNNQNDYSVPSQLKTLRSVNIKYISCGEDFSVFLTQVRRA